MNIWFISLLAFVAGVFLAVQAVFNTHLGALVQQPVLATVSASLSSAIFGCILLLIIGKEAVQPRLMSQVPSYLWFAGGLLSMVGVSLYFYTIPKLGISTMITLGLCGQLIFSVVAGAFGWFGLPVEPITFKKLMGICTMIASIILIQSK